MILHPERSTRIFIISRIHLPQTAYGLAAVPPLLYDRDPWNANATAPLPFQRTPAHVDTPLPLVYNGITLDKARPLCTHPQPGG